MAAITTVTPATKRYPQRIGTTLQWHGTITGPASYTNGGGDSIVPALFGMTKIDGGVVGAGQGGRVYELVPQTDGSVKLKAFGSNGAAPAALAEIANATNLSGDTPFAFVIGR